MVFDIALPLACEPLIARENSMLANRKGWWLYILGRLSPGETISQANVSIQALSKPVVEATVPLEWDTEHQKEFLNSRFSLQAASTGFSDFRGQYKTALWTLMITSTLVLLAACLNIASFLLARSSARQRELSVRLAIGAGRMRLVRQLLTECMLLTIAGAAAALVLATWGSKLLMQMVSRSDDHLSFDLSLNASMLAFVAVSTVVTALLFGLAPVLISVRASLNASLKNSARTVLAGSSRLQPMRVMLTIQMALSLVLVTGASLFIGTLQNFLRVDPGVHTQGVLIAKTRFKANNLTAEQQHARQQNVLQSLQALPGVTSTAVALRTPISNYGWNELLEPQGYKPQSRLDTLVWMNRVSPGYFATMGTPLRLGRDFADTDRPHTQKVIVIDELAAQRFFPNANPLGKLIGLTLQPGQQKELHQVVGVVKPSKYARLNEDTRMTAFVAANQGSEVSNLSNFVLRSTLPIDKLIPSVRKAILAAGGDTTIDFRSLQTQLNDSLLQPRAVATLGIPFRPAWIATGGDRLIWRDGLRSLPPAQRDWHPDRLGSAARLAYMAHAQGCRRAPGAWRRPWIVGFNRARTTNSKFALWPASKRSAVSCRGNIGACHLCLWRGLFSGQKRGKTKSHRSIARRVSYCAGGPSGLGAQPVFSRVSATYAIFHPVGVFKRLNESTPQWLNLPFK